ncbi:type II secretion system protein J [uncultured Gimesia sp.]|uniref:PulJ/GspJ family protein n=1 Tax=uncultured Gimesia sp. TaxID=1678688 RepID=UPI0026105A25|nr:prepilin-type N-terminal cleavage/methylation domain-containing protein [uncultured Gimesia sp.]
MNQSKIHQSRIPRGVTLIELMVVISLLSVLFTVGITTLAFLMRVEMKGTARIQETLNLQKLSQQFREDAGIAQKAVINAPDKNRPNVLRLELESGSFIIYSGTKKGNAILRLKMQGDKIIARNEFLIPVDSVRFALEKLNQRLMVSMTFKILPELKHENQTVKQPEKIFKVESFVNRKLSIQSRITQKK